MKRRWLSGCVAAAILVAPALSAASPAGAAPSHPKTTPAWVVTASPDTTNYKFPVGVSCVSATACKAVGNYVNVSGTQENLIESWNGTSWTVTPVPDNGSNSNALAGVSCVSTTFCEAVGSYTAASGAVQTLIEAWNGTSWSIAPSPNVGTGTNTLQAVACLTATFCQAAGYAVNASNVIQTLVETWNGTSWSLSSTPNAGTGTNMLFGVSCSSPTSCQAVGGETNSSGVTQTLTESWNGSSWTLSTSPNNGTGTNLLNNVTCLPAATTCVAVGYHLSATNVIQTLVESWNGSAWSVITSPNAGTASNALYGVSCSAASSCTAAGYSVNGSGAIQTLIEAWNGTSWTVSTSPNNGTGANALYGVSCGTGFCKAVGSFMTTTGVTQSLAESWNGTAWSLTATPGGVLGNTLAAVSCEAAGSSCQAVGSFVNTSGVKQTLVEVWYGGAWLILPTPDVGIRANTLAGISCISDSFCKAVGSYISTNGTSQTLIESWDGVAWRLDPSPNSGTLGNTLGGVSCVSATFCEAVGSSVNASNISQTLVETWNGTTWSITPSANNGTRANALTAVSCLSTGFCQAVGSYLKFATVNAPLAEKWNGATWSVVTTANNGANSNAFTGVSCASPTSCKAVGYYRNSSSVQQTLAESWSGTAFIIAHSANSGTGANVLNAVTCPSTTGCYAVGFAGAQTFVESLSGTTWSIVASPNVASASNALSGVSCLAVTTCAAVGTSTGTASHVPQTLIESN